MVCVKRSVRLSSKGIDRWRGSFFERGAERSVETLREMRNRSCACGRPASPLPSRLLCSPLLFAVSFSLSLSLFRLHRTAASTSPPCLSFGPVCLPTRDQTQIQFSRPRSPETTIYSFKQTLLLLLLLLFLFLSPSLIPPLYPCVVLPLVWHLVCPWTDAVHSWTGNFKISKLPRAWLEKKKKENFVARERRRKKLLAALVSFFNCIFIFVLFSLKERASSNVG